MRPIHSFDRGGFLFSIQALLVIGAILFIGRGLLHSASLEPQVGLPSRAAVAKSALARPFAARADAATYSSETPRRIIETLRVEDVIPSSGKFIAVDLAAMKLSLYEDGALVAGYPVLSKGRPGTPWETPAGFYAVRTKEENHFSTIGKVYMPYSMEFYGNYFIHGWTHYPDGTPTSATFSGGCIKLSVEDSKKIFQFADIGTKIFVADASPQTALPPPLILHATDVLALSADAYLVADLDTRDVYLEHAAQNEHPIASITKLMTALVANEIISFDRTIAVPEGALANPPRPENNNQKTFPIGVLLYPLLIHSSNGIADSLARYYGAQRFVGWMNVTARSLDMAGTTFVDPSGGSVGDVSTPDDLFRLAAYLVRKKSFIFKITHLPQKTITAADGSSYLLRNVNSPAADEHFEGGKAGHTTAAKDTMLALFKFMARGQSRHIAIIVLGSDNREDDTRRLADWLTTSAEHGAQIESACAACIVPKYRTIDL